MTFLIWTSFVNFGSCYIISYLISMTRFFIHQNHQLRGTCDKQTENNYIKHFLVGGCETDKSICQKNNLEKGYFELADFRIWQIHHSWRSNAVSLAAGCVPSVLTPYSRTPENRSRSENKPTGTCLRGKNRDYKLHHHFARLYSISPHSKPSVDPRKAS